MAARACVDAAVAQVLAAGGGVRDAAELAAAYLQRSGNPPRSLVTLIRLVRDNDAFRRASVATAHAAERVAAARIVAGEPQWLVARTSRIDLARSQQRHPPGPPAGPGISQSGATFELSGPSAAPGSLSAAPLGGSSGSLSVLGGSACRWWHVDDGGGGFQLPEMTLLFSFWR